MWALKSLTPFFVHATCQVFPPAKSLPSAVASDTSHPVECESVAAKRKTLGNEMAHLANARSVIQGLKTE